MTDAQAAIAAVGYYRSRMEELSAARVTVPDATRLSGIRTRGEVHCVLCAPIVMAHTPHCSTCGRHANNVESLGMRHKDCPPGARFVARDAMGDDVEPLRDRIKAHAHGRKTTECDLCGETVRWID